MSLQRLHRLQDRQHVVLDIYLAPQRLFTFAAAMNLSSVPIPTKSRIKAFSARSLDAAVWATIPGLGSQKIWFVMACLKIRRVSMTLNPHDCDVVSKVVSSPTGKVLAIL